MTLFTTRLSDNDVLGIEVAYLKLIYMTVWTCTRVEMAGEEKKLGGSRALRQKTDKQADQSGHTTCTISNVYYYMIAIASGKGTFQLRGAAKSCEVI